MRHEVQHHAVEWLGIKKIAFKSILTRVEADIREVVHVFRGGTPTVRKQNNNP